MDPDSEASAEISPDVSEAIEILTLLKILDSIIQQLFLHVLVTSPFDRKSPELVHDGELFENQDMIQGLKTTLNDWIAVKNNLEAINGDEAVVDTETKEKLLAVEAWPAFNWIVDTLYVIVGFSNRFLTRLAFDTPLY